MTIASESGTHPEQTTSNLKQLTVGLEEGARVTGIGIHTFRQFVREGKIKVIRVGNRVRIPRRELEDFVNREAK
jgi:excisionase family DNA binding protein